MEMVPVLQVLFGITVLMETLLILLRTEMLRTIMEMLHYPHLKFFVTLTQKFEKKRKKRKQKQKSTYLLALLNFVLIVLFSTYYPQFSFTHFLNF